MMTGLMKIVFGLAVFLPCIIFAAESKWYYIGQDDQVIADITLRPGERKAFSIKSSTKREYMFQVEMKPEDTEKIKKGPYPVEMKQVGTNNTIRTFYGGLKCDPAKGVITLELTNISNREHKVVLFEPIGWNR
jgi:hypothetical protein